MKRTQQLQQEVYEQALNSGYFKNMQAQLKTYVYDLIEKQYNHGNSKTGFQYEHPLLPKLKKYPLTSICMDLIQQFLESFKFKHTLNVFRKQINRSSAINRIALSEKFKIQIKNPQSKAVLLGLVEQMVSGDVGAVKATVRTNNFMEPAPEPLQPQRPNFMGDHQKPVPKPQPIFKHPSNNSSSSSNINQSSSFNNSTSSNIDSKINITTPKLQQKKDSPPSNIPPTVQNNSPSVEKIEVKQQKQTKKGGKQDKNKKKKEEKEKPPEAATDLLGGVFKKFEGSIKTAADKEKEKKEMFEAKRAFSQEKEKKVVDAAESGANKIRGASMPKSMNSLLSKLMPQTAVAPKNQSYIDQEMDEFQQSKDSTRKNPLFSSGESGFQKSGFYDMSVDSDAIVSYDCVEKAKKVTKKL